MTEFSDRCPIIIGYPRSVPDVSDRMKPQILEIVS